MTNDTPDTYGKPPLLRADGLENVVAATTRLSDVDGAAGRLVVAGHPIEELAGSASFEDVLHVLFTGRRPDEAERRAISRALGDAREAAFGRLGDLGDALALSDPMDALRAATAHLSSTDVDATGILRCARLAGAIAVFAAAWSRAAEGGQAVQGIGAGARSPIRPDASAPHAADYLRMVTGTVASPAQVDALDAYLVTVVDHGMNASTFTARVVASTASDTVSAVVAALGALKGKLHGGAPGPVLDMLDAIGSPDDARAWLEGSLDRGERIMGMGHRVYRVRDPRAFVLERAVARFEAASGSPTRRLRLARAVEHEAERLLAARHPERPLKANVEFYTAVLLEAVGLPRTLFTPTFAASRVVGWCAHVEEQRRVGRLIRPTSLYVDTPPP